MTSLHPIPTSLRQRIPGTLFLPPSLDLRYMAAVILLADSMFADKERQRLWQLTNSGDGCVWEIWNFWAYCLRIAHVEILKSVYWEKEKYE